MYSKFECLSRFLLSKASEHMQEAEEIDIAYIKGYLVGESTAYELCAKWIKDIINDEPQKE